MQILGQHERRRTHWEHHQPCSLGKRRKSNIQAKKSCYYIKFSLLKDIFLWSKDSPWVCFRVGSKDYLFLTLELHISYWYPILSFLLYNSQPSLLLFLPHYYLSSKFPVRSHVTYCSINDSMSELKAKSDVLGKQSFQTNTLL